MDETRFYRCAGFNLPGTLDKIKRSSDFMSPVYEALSNSLDAVAELENVSGLAVASAPIRITFDFTGLFSENAPKRLETITIQDSGIGFTKENYERFLSLNDRSKSALNKGSGRVQLIKFFSRAEYESVFWEECGESKKLAKRAFSLSAEKAYLDRNAIVYETERVGDAEPQNVGTGATLRLREPLDDGWTRQLEETTPLNLKQKILARFFLRLNDKRKTPRIEIIFRIDNKEIDRASIESSDFVAPRQTVEIEVPYKFRATCGSKRRFEKTGKVEKFKVEGFAVKGSFLTQNSEAFVCRGEVVENAKLGLANADEKIDDFHYVVAISGDYVDKRVAEARDGLGFLCDREFDEAPALGSEAADVSVDDVRKAAREACAQIFPELDGKKKELRRKLEHIGTNFGFAKSTLDAVRSRLPLNASTKEILKRLYNKEAGKAANADETIDSVLRRIRKLDPNSKRYREELKEQADSLFELIPEQNKTALPHYFARRKIVLDLLGDALERKLEIQSKDGRQQEESLLHNILFSRRSHNPSSSDLWILNEEYVYFSGTSDVPFNDVEYQGKRILAPLEEFSEKDRDFIRERSNNRPDILLFPEERKCVVVELKRPGVDLSDYIPQINKYVSLIFNYSAAEFKFDQFYAYLIGDDFNPQDVRAVDPEYKLAEKFGYMFATRGVASKDAAQPDGEMYAEIHSYRTLFERAKTRNKMFLDPLLNDVEDRAESSDNQ